VIPKGHKAARLSAPDQPQRAVGRFAALEGYRGLAALLVVIFHVYQFDRVGYPLTVYPYAGTPWDVVIRNMDSMVDLFLVLSAFLLGLPFARAVLRQGSEQTARGFLLRRAVRIVPVYWFAIILVWATRNPNPPGDWRDLIEHLTFTSTFDNKRFFYTIGPAWSLAIEVQFYLLLAVLAVAAQVVSRRLRTHRARAALLLGGVGALGAISIVYKLYFYFDDPQAQTNWVVWFSLPAKLDIFASGLLLACLRALWTGQVPRVARQGLRLAAGATLAAAFVLRQPGAPDTWFHGVCAVGFTLLLAATVLGGEDGWSRSLGWPPLAFLGLVSYSLYLWHEPVLLWLHQYGLVPDPAGSAFPLTVIVTSIVGVAVAAVSFYLLERPTMLLSKTFDRGGRAVEYYEEHRQPVP
jgi:peptidoglycan/LPS O-acetylase OafA/YrhL